MGYWYCGPVGLVCYGVVSASEWLRLVSGWVGWLVWFVYLLCLVLVLFPLCVFDGTLLILLCTLSVLFVSRTYMGLSGTCVSEPPCRGGPGRLGSGISGPYIYPRVRAIRALGHRYRPKLGILEVTRDF